MQSLKKIKIPSKPWLTFYSVVGAFSGLTYYDYREKLYAQKELQIIAQPLADKPLSPIEMPQRVVVCLCPPHDNVLRTSRWYFSQYVSPVLNAAAVDYTILQGETPEELRDKVREYIWKGKRASLRERAALGHMHEFEKRLSLWNLLTAPFRSKMPPFEAFFPSKDLQVEEESKEQVLKRLVEELKDGKYSENDIIVTIGRASYRETLRGIEDASLSCPSVDVKDATEDAKYFDADFKLPPILYIPFYQKSGFSNLPIRIYDWFRQHKILSEIGHRTLLVTGESKQRGFGTSATAKVPDENIGLDVEKHELLAELGSDDFDIVSRPSLSINNLVKEKLTILE